MNILYAAEVAAGSTNGDLPGWVVPAATIIVAIVSAIGLIIVRKTRGPVTIQDLWKENRDLRTDLTAMEKKVDRLFQTQRTQFTINRIMGEGFDALSSYVERTTAAGTKPKFTSLEHEAIVRARALRSEDTSWDTLQRGELDSNDSYFTEDSRKK